MKQTELRQTTELLPTIAAALEMHRKGTPVSDIAEDMGLTWRAVYDWVSLYRGKEHIVKAYARERIQASNIANKVIKNLRRSPPQDGPFLWVKINDKPRYITPAIFRNYVNKLRDLHKETIEEVAQ